MSIVEKNLGLQKTIISTVLYCAQVYNTHEQGVYEYTCMLRIQQFGDICVHIYNTWRVRTLQTLHRCYIEKVRHETGGLVSRRRYLSTSINIGAPVSLCRFFEDINHPCINLSPLTSSTRQHTLSTGNGPGQKHQAALFSQRPQIGFPAILQEEPDHLWVPTSCISSRPNILIPWSDG